MEGLNITDTSFNGTAATYIITRAVIGSDTVDEGCLMIQDGIKYKHIIPRMTITLPFAIRQATPTSTATITVDGNVIIPQNYMCYTEFNPRDLESYWTGYLLPERLIDAALPQSFEGYMIDTYLKQVNQGNEYMIWRGRTAYNPLNGGLDPTTKNCPATDANYYYFDGLMVSLLNSTGTIQVPTPVTITSANVIATMNSVYSYIPVPVLRQKNLRFHMSVNTWRLYSTALTSNTFKDNQTTEATTEAFKGFEIVVLGGMPDNTVIAAVSTEDKRSMFWLGLNSEADAQSPVIMKTTNASELYFIKILLKAGVQFAFSEEITVYTTVLQ